MYLWLYKANVSSSMHLWLYKANVSNGMHLWLYKANVSNGMYLWLYKANVSSSMPLWLYKANVSNSMYLWLYKANVPKKACAVSFLGTFAQWKCLSVFCCCLTDNMLKLHYTCWPSSSTCCLPVFLVMSPQTGTVIIQCHFLCFSMKVYSLWKSANIFSVLKVHFVWQGGMQVLKPFSPSSSGWQCPQPRTFLTALPQFSPLHFGSLYCYSSCTAAPDLLGFLLIQRGRT